MSRRKPEVKVTHRHSKGQLDLLFRAPCKGYGDALVGA